MAAKFGFDEDEENVLIPDEPQISSEDPSERKAGRLLRIKRRQEALRRAQQAADEALVDEEPGPIELATQAAAEELQRLALEGASNVTNVKITTDEREVMRRAMFSNKMLSSLQKIEEEAEAAHHQYEAIGKEWDVMLALRDPLDIDAEIKTQRKRCDELLQQKDILIAELKNDLKNMDIAYYEDLDRQDNDIKELSDRVQRQVTIMQRAFEKQLSLIEKAIYIEREAMVEHNKKRWDALHRQRDREEVAHLKYRFEQLEEQKQDIETIMWDHFEKYREAKIELETLIQELQRELEKLKSICLINTEKIGYNLQILKKREEENVFVRSQQKRKLNKMADVANKLRAKIRKAAEDGAVEETKADQEIMRLMQTMSDIEKKSNQFSHVNHYKFSQIRKAAEDGAVKDTKADFAHCSAPYADHEEKMSSQFSHVNYYKFNQVWRMAAARCAELTRDLRQGEVALHAHILAEPPPPPPPAPPVNPLIKYEHEETESPELVECDADTDPKNAVARDAKERLVRHILQLVADNTGFLVEDRLLKLIDKYKIESRNLCTLDAIFMALEIQAEEDIELLCKTFLNYAFCPICVGMEAASELMDPAIGSPEGSRHPSIRSRGDRMSLRGRPSINRSLSVSTSRSHVAYRGHDLSPADQEIMTEAEEILLKCGGDPRKASTLVSGATPEVSVSGSAKRGARGVTVAAAPLHEAPQKTLIVNPFLCPVGHHLEIEPMQVLTALGEFMAVFVPPEKKRLYEILDSLKPPTFSSPSRRISPDEIDQYWAQWKSVFPLEKDRFWDGLLTGLNNYLPILQERERIHEEVSALRRRSAALRRLVRGALPDLPPPAPKYARPPAHFTCTFADDAPAHLPPI